jgi:hypothetical protein
MLHYLLHVNLPFSHLLKIWVYPCLVFNFPWLVVSVNIFRNIFVFFSFRYTASHCIGKTIDVNRVTDLSSSPCFKCPRVRPCECGCMHEDTLFTLSRLVELNSSADGWSYWRRCLAIFPRYKGRTKLIAIPFWQFWVALIIHIVTSVTEDVYSWARWLTATVFSLRFCFSLLEFTNNFIFWTTAD